MAVFFIFFRLGRGDLLSDDAHYAFRSIGYFDYVASFEQTTPIQWFHTRPWWSYLSFHDHPPLFFAVQHLFFKLFGVSLAVSRLPSALAAVGTLFAVFFLARKLWGARAALLAAGALTFNSYFIWTGRIGLLESVFVFFLTLGLLFLVKGLRDHKKYFIYAGAIFGLSFLTKYTFLFAVPGIFFYLIFQERWIFKNRRFWTGLLVFLAVSSPIFIYNLEMFRARGHFDVQFADLFGQANTDWSNLTSRVGERGFGIAEIGAVVKTLSAGFSLPYLVIFLICLGGFFLPGFRRKNRNALPIFLFWSLFIFFIYIGDAPRWLGVMSPFAALVMAPFLDYVWRPPVTAAAAVLALFFAFYSVNTNLLRNPLFSDKLYARFRVENFGYNQLDRRILELVKGARVNDAFREVVRSWWYRDLDKEEVDFPEIYQGDRELPFIIIYDSNTEWFPTLWVFERWRFYHRIFTLNSEEFLRVLGTDEGVNTLRALNIAGISYVRASNLVAERANIDFEESQILADDYIKQGIEPEIIYDDRGREAFYIYHGAFQ